MINISLSPVLVLFMCIVFLITGIYCLKCILFYHENKDKLNDEKFTKFDETEKPISKMDYREFRKKDIYNHSVMKFANDVSNDLELKRQKRYEDYLKEGF